MSVFFDRFERHDHGDGLKAHSTHYCPGCGHGLAHKYLSEAIEELAVQDRTIAVSPVGCSVFLYYYLDVGNTQAAHGRAPAVALGHKLANPESVVICYQGDGDLAAIGLAEIVSVAQLGIPISVIFVNNAIYGMTGGQMAPTTLSGQKTSTSPRGRQRFTGEPLKVAELIAGLDGPVYVERVALFDPKNRVKAKKAIKKAIRLQVEGRGFSLVEVLAECPTHLKLTPLQNQKWVKEQMVPRFPLGVKKDVVSETPWPLPAPPSFAPERLLDVIGGAREGAPRFTSGFPETRWGRDIGVKLAGAGGDGAQTAALLLVNAAIGEGFDATHIPSYGPASRGGTSYADVRIAEREVLSPGVPEPDVLVAFNAPSVAKFARCVGEGGVFVYDSSVVAGEPDVRPGVAVLGVPFTRIAADLGNVVVKNVVALGALQEATHLLPKLSLLAALRRALGDKCALLQLNEEAFARGARRAARLDAVADPTCPELQADGAPCASVSGACGECEKAH